MPYSFNHDAFYLHYPFLKLDMGAGWTEPTFTAKRNYPLFTTVHAAKLDETIFRISTS